MSSTQHAHYPAALFDHTLASGDTREVVQSRFGEIVIDTRNALMFPKGLLGMPQCRNFALANFPSEKMQQFKLLQCLDDLSMSFIALPGGVQNAIVSEDDVRLAARELDIEESDLIMLFIVCVHRNPDATRLSVNARAPVFIDASRKSGAQYVFLHDQYRVQHYIT